MLKEKLSLNSKHAPLLPQKLKISTAYDGKILKVKVSDEGPDILLSLKSFGDMGFRGSGLTPERRKILKLLGLRKESLITCYQVHSKSVFYIEKPSYNMLEGDGLITDNPSLILGVTVADCMPIYFYDRKQKIFGIVHSGWKGTGIIAEAVIKLQMKWKSEKKDIDVVLGPSAGNCCYAVDKSRSREFSRMWGDKSVDNRDGKYYLDLKAANISILERIGITHVYDMHECTICNEKYGSFRREGPDDYTRMLALIGYFE